MNINKTLKINEEQTADLKKKDIAVPQTMAELEEIPEKNSMNFIRIIDQQNIAVSIITAGGLIYGALNTKELKRIKKDLELFT